ncbi:hypothetical protein AWB66_00707 [Caballeronia telluris]|uniref:Uncharacterized protein n=1 Tax=Caballeronia telluris TaxID=326475 RepID=A0A158FAA7_9BURK|nr:hypothetical protein AWB66_00707 [Caballeronia telluris]
MARAISSRRPETGSASGNVIGGIGFGSTAARSRRGVAGFCARVSSEARGARGRDGSRAAGWDGVSAARAFGRVSSVVRGARGWVGRSVARGGTRRSARCGASPGALSLAEARRARGRPSSGWASAGTFGVSPRAAGFAVPPFARSFACAAARCCAPTFCCFLLGRGTSAARLRDSPERAGGVCTACRSPLLAGFATAPAFPDVPANRRAAASFLLRARLASSSPAPGGRGAPSRNRFSRSFFNCS